MIGLVGVEILKIRTTRRALLGWVATVVLLVGLLATAAAFAPPEEGGDPAQADVTVADVVGAAWLAAIVGLLLGIIAATNEWRHGTVAITFLVTPSRWPVVAAKLLSAAIAAAFLAFLGLALATLIATAVLNGRDLSAEIDTEVWTEATQILVAATMAGALGSALGSLVQSQVPALIVTVGWFLIAEPTVAVLADLLDFGDVSTYLPASAFTAVDSGWSIGTLVALGYLVVFSLAAAERTRRRDVT